MKHEYKPIRFYITVFAFTWPFLFAAAAIVVLANRDMFFETRYVGDLLDN
jgi:hypothetical protein